MELSIVIPVYNSGEFITNTVEQVLNVIKENKYKAEVVLVNDGSKDNSWEVISSIANKESEVKAINLLKNYGQHNAVLCGFEYAKGQYIITMDDDLQNPPSEIVPLFSKAREGGYDLVFGQFKDKKHASYRKWGSRFVGYLNSKVFNKPKNLILTNFRIVKSDVVKRVLQHKTAYPYIPGLLLMYASNMSNVMVEHHERKDGKSNYTFRKIGSLVGRLLINYSSYPLRMLSFIGLIVSLISFFVAISYLVIGLFSHSTVPGWTTLVVLISFFGGFIIALLGVIGEYLSRILEQLSSHSSYFISEVVD